jgi:hypothetical protein
MMIYAHDFLVAKDMEGKPPGDALFFDSLDEVSHADVVEMFERMLAHFFLNCSLNFNLLYRRAALLSQLESVENIPEEFKDLLTVLHTPKAPKRKQCSSNPRPDDDDEEDEADCGSTPKRQKSSTSEHAEASTAPEPEKDFQLQTGHTESMDTECSESATDLGEGLDEVGDTSPFKVVRMLQEREEADSDDSGQLPLVIDWSKGLLQTVN